MARGNPCQEQLDLSIDMFRYGDSSDLFAASDGTDCRNYGIVDGIPEAKELFSQLLDVDTTEIIIGNNSSLNQERRIHKRHMVRPAVQQPRRHYILGRSCGKVRFHGSKGR